MNPLSVVFTGDESALVHVLAVVDGAVSRCNAAAEAVVAASAEEAALKDKGSDLEIKGAKATTKSAAEELATAAQEVAMAKKALAVVSGLIADAAMADASAAGRRVAKLLGQDLDTDAHQAELSAATALAADAIVVLAGKQALATDARKEAEAALSFANAAALFADFPADLHNFPWDQTDMSNEKDTTPPPSDLKEDTTKPPPSALMDKPTDLKEKVVDPLGINKELQTLDKEDAERVRRLIERVVAPLRPHAQKGVIGPFREPRDHKRNENNSMRVFARVGGGGGGALAVRVLQAAELIQLQLARNGQKISVELVVQVLSSPYARQIVPAAQAALPHLLRPLPEDLPFPDPLLPQIVLPDPPPVILIPKVYLPPDFLPKLPDVPPEKLPVAEKTEQTSKKSFDWQQWVKRISVSTAIKTIGGKVYQGYKMGMSLEPTPEADDFYDNFTR